MLTPLFIALDPSLGRIDKASLSEQTLMELLIVNISNKEVITGSTDESPDISEWSKVEMDDAGIMRRLNWQDMGLDGSIDAQYIPDSVTDLYINKNFLRGTFDTKSLPKNLCYISLGGNQFYGTIALDNLPKKLIAFDASENSFECTLDLTKLPPNLEYLDLHTNAFEGTLDLTQLPNSLEELYLHCNPHLTGETDFSKLPESLIGFDITNTDLSGKITVEGDKCFSVENDRIQSIVR